MALIDKTRNLRWSHRHLLVRCAGLTGLVIGGIGLLLALAKNMLSWHAVRATLAGEAGTGISRLALALLAFGGMLALAALIVEFVVILRLAASRRSTFGINAAVQVVLAGVLLLGVNGYSYRHYLRFDWTRNRQFTLPPKIQGQLRRLKGETTIVVYQRHKTFGQLSDKPDAYDYAAERKVVEKVKDLVEQFRELGPQFRVVVLDVEEDGYDNKLAALTQESQALRDAIDRAPENSIFFHAKETGTIQQLSFNDFYQLDKTASQEAGGRRGNLVLLYQGVEPFARKVLNIDEKRPKIGVAVVHEWLTTEGPEEFGLGGVKKVLAARGFDVHDVILKKWSEVAPPEPAVYTYEESKFERVEEELTEADAAVKSLNEDQQQLAKVLKQWESSSLDELTKAFQQQLKGRRVTEELRRRQVELFRFNLQVWGALLKQHEEDRAKVEKELRGLNRDRATEQRRMTDLKAKLDRSLADCDLLFIPRMTLRNVNIGDRIPNRVYRLDDAQVAAVKDFLKAGKPVLACFGPTNEPVEERPDPRDLASGPDKLEDLLGQVGIHFGRQTVLFNTESKSFAERRSGLLISGVNVEVPPVAFDWQPGAGRLLSQAELTERKPNPIRASMRITARSVGKDLDRRTRADAEKELEGAEERTGPGKMLDLRVRHPRPIYYAPDKSKRLAFEPEFMMTDPASWNDDQPFPTRDRTPRFSPPPDDPAKGTPDEKRRGPFPIGVAVETTLPDEWYEDTGGNPATVRVAAVGHGGVFVGSELSPAKEKLLLNTCNWLLSRDDLLPQSDRVWTYPRVPLSPFTHGLWRWGTWLGLPGLFGYLGLVVLLVRRLR